MVATRWWHGLALLVALATAWPQRGEAQFCVGDCDGNGRVVIADLIIGVSIALGFDRPCCSGYSGDVTVALLVQAVNNALTAVRECSVCSTIHRTAISCRPGRWRRGSTCRPAPIPTR